MCGLSNGFGAALRSAAGEFFFSPCTHKPEARTRIQAFSLTSSGESFMQPFNPNGNAVNRQGVQQQGQANDDQREDEVIVDQQQAPVMHPQAQNAALLAALLNHPPVSSFDTQLMQAAQNADSQTVARLLNIAAHMQADQPQDP
jgi:hypothetical protein